MTIQNNGLGIALALLNRIIKENTVNPETTEHQSSLEIAIGKLKDARKYQAETLKQFTKADCENEVAIERCNQLTWTVTTLIDSHIKDDPTAVAVMIDGSLFVRAPYDSNNADADRPWVLAEITNIDINASIHSLLLPRGVKMTTNELLPLK
jgi:hypothetical protein